MMKTRGFELILFILCIVSGLTARAADYPTKPIRLIVPLTAGGPTDILARIIAAPLGAALGHQVIVDNRPGAGGNIGADLAAKSPPDGYTLFMGTSGPLAITRLVGISSVWKPAKIKPSWTFARSSNLSSRGWADGVR